MNHPLIISAKGKALIDSSVRRSLKELGSIWNKQNPVATKYIMSQTDWDDIVKYSKDQ